MVQKAVQKLNVWDEAQVQRAEKTWGHKLHPYTVELFDFIIANGRSWLDLGCGFGRFLEYLLAKIEDPDYIGYDSSPDMIARLRERFPAFFVRTFERSITTPLTDKNTFSIISSAVFIHITLEEQNTVLDNLKAANPVAIAFDINSPNERFLERGTHFERQIALGCSNKFRMTWQSHYEMTKKVLRMFPNYDLKLSFHSLQAKRHKVLYMLKRRT